MQPLNQDMIDFHLLDMHATPIFEYVWATPRHKGSKDF